jgi:beta-lactamase class A
VLVDTPIRERRRQVRGPRHLSEERSESFSKSFFGLGELGYRGARVSASAADVSTGRELLQIDDSIVLPTASVGKVLLLIELAAAMGVADPRTTGLADKDAGTVVGDSGMWRHMRASTLPVQDLAVLIGAVSDNVATNVLLSRFGLDGVRARTEELGMRRTALLDTVRDHRGPDDAPQLSVGSTAELVWLFSALARGEVVDYATSHRVLGWLSLNTDLSMVASAFGLDPLAHGRADHQLALANKTGSDVGVRSEAGVLRGPRAGVAYAVTVTFNDADLASRLIAMEAMRTVGYDLLDYVH